MKTKLSILTVLVSIGFIGQALAGGGHDHSSHEYESHKGSMYEEISSDAVNVGNKICPVSDQEIGSMGEGVQVEHEGVIYNLCCSMCAKDFKKDPEKYIKIIEKEMKQYEEDGENHKQNHAIHDDDTEYGHKKEAHSHDHGQHGH